ncbi:MAG: hypothetical protein UX86_C0017G0009 [Candidatus Amesbacteria bacterium GW2011_GWC1_47_15]|uniref:Core-binding (CB) domain-containing protein n=1 Tax=Candidatus Amesbacteria bacterium GW2011_GWC1_47_15 TaxID=1618364 RepID=A0A0G1S359_9BACT|nr:MAG: hypothetical protein UX86_C0017G0009 [Candidatus Amesbacteria bacterium GW2011_GWC1_47_15]
MTTPSTPYAGQLLSDYREFLISRQVSPNTLKNYLSDLRIFFFFLNSLALPVESGRLNVIFTPEVLSQFSQYLSTINPAATVKRRLSSLRKFQEYAHQNQLLASPETSFSADESAVTAALPDGTDPLPTPVIQPVEPYSPPVMDVPQSPDHSVTTFPPVGSEQENPPTQINPYIMYAPPASVTESPPSVSDNHTSRPSDLIRRLPDNFVSSMVTSQRSTKIWYYFLPVVSFILAFLITYIVSLASSSDSSPLSLYRSVQALASNL